MTEFKQQVSRTLDEKKPTAILRNSKVEGCYVSAESTAESSAEPLTFYTLSDARVEELILSILDQRSEVLAYLSKR